jgi:hypothetical protein
VNSAVFLIVFTKSIVVTGVMDALMNFFIFLLSIL